MPEVEELDLTARVEEILNRHAAVGLAVGVVRDGHLAFFHGHGVADIASNTPVTGDTVFRIASITKTFTAIAVMQLCEQGRLDLDAPAGGYLRAYRLLPARAGFRPATVRDLLTHTAGVPQMPHPARALRTLFAGSALRRSRACWCTPPPGGCGPSATSTPTTRESRRGTGPARRSSSGRPARTLPG